MMEKPSFRSRQELAFHISTLLSTYPLKVQCGGNIFRCWGRLFWVYLSEQEGGQEVMRRPATRTAQLASLRRLMVTVPCVHKAFWKFPEHFHIRCLDSYINPVMNEASILQLKKSAQRRYQYSITANKGAGSFESSLCLLSSYTSESEIRACY